MEKRGDVVRKILDTLFRNKKLSIGIPILIATVLFSLTSCSLIEAIKYTVSGDIIDPAEGFSRGEEDGVLVYQDNKYILVQDINGDCEIDITEEDILLGQTSNFPFFPNSFYHVNPDENPSFIMGGTSYLGTFVYLREDLYNAGVVYQINDSLEFEFSSAFIETDKKDYDRHIAQKKSTKYAVVDFYVKGVPTILARKTFHMIDDVWYCVEVDVAYQLSDEFVSRLIEEGIINKEEVL